MKILVVDDQPDILALMTLILQGEGHDVTAVNDGIYALQKLQQIPFDLILLDIMMPGITGIDLVQEIRKTPSAKHIPVVAVSAKVKEEDSDHLIKAGFTNYLSKPFTGDELTDIISQYNPLTTSN